MKRRMDLAVSCSVVWSLVCASGCLLGAESREAGASAPVPLASAATNGLTVGGAIQLALANNPALRVSGAKVEASVGRAQQAGRWTNPELELAAEDWPVDGGGGFGDAKQTIGVAQVLPYPGKKSADRKIGGAGVKQSEAGLALRRTEVVRDVKAGYFRVLSAERLVEVSGQLVAVAESFATAARKRAEAGATPFQEQLRAELQLEQARTELAGFQRELANARQAFGTLLGRPDLAGVGLSGVLAEVPDLGLLEDPGAESWAGHPVMVAAQANLERAQLEQRRARLDPYPDVKVGVAGGRIGETDESILQLGIVLPLPLLDLGKGRQREARAEVSVAEAELEGVQQQLRHEWANANRRYRTAAELVGGFRERILPKAAEALRLVEMGFEQGKFAFMDVVDTQRTAAEARLAYHQKLLEMNVAQAELEALLRPYAAQAAITH